MNPISLTAFTIVMPYYKNSHVVRRSVHSVLAQTYSNFELIIIDDGSGDDIATILSEFNDNRIKLHQIKNAGVAHARNLAIDLSSKEWICFLDSDDEWLSDHLEHLVYLIDKYKQSSFFVTSHRRLGKNVVESNSLLDEFTTEDFVCDDLLDLVFKKGEVIHTNSICIKRTIFDIVGMFVEGVSIGEDTDLWYTISMYYPPVMSKKTTTLYHRDASFLTKQTKFATQWPFCRRKYILEDESVPENRKKSMLLVLQRYQLTICKHLMESGNVKESCSLFNDIKDGLLPEVDRQKKQVSILLNLPPVIATIIAKQMYKLKMKNY